MIRVILPAVMVVLFFVRTVIVLLHYRSGYKINLCSWISTQKLDCPNYLAEFYHFIRIEVTRLLRIKPWRDTLRAYRAKKVAGKEFLIHYYIGGGLGGQTDFRLWGDGSYQLWSTVTKGRKRKSYSGQVPLSEVEQVLQEMLTVNIWRVRHDPSTRLDDAKAMVSVKARGKKSMVILWASEVRESPPFVAVQRPLLALIRDISEGEVFT